MDYKRKIKLLLPKIKKNNLFFFVITVNSLKIFAYYITNIVILKNIIINIKTNI